MNADYEQQLASINARIASLQAEARKVEEALKTEAQKAEDAIWNDGPKERFINLLLADASDHLSWDPDDGYDFRSGIVPRGLRQILMEKLVRRPIYRMEGREETLISSPRATHTFEFYWGEDAWYTLTIKRYGRRGYDREATISQGKRYKSAEDWDTMSRAWGGGSWDEVLSSPPYTIVAALIGCQEEYEWEILEGLLYACDAGMDAKLAEEGDPKEWPSLKKLLSTYNDDVGVKDDLSASLI